MCMTELGTKRLMNAIKKSQKADRDAARRARYEAAKQRCWEAIKAENAKMDAMKPEELKAYLDSFPDE